jgi:hypothetical protein
MPSTTKKLRGMCRRGNTFWLRHGTGRAGYGTNLDGLGGGRVCGSPLGIGLQKDAKAAKNRNGRKKAQKATKTFWGMTLAGRNWEVTVVDLRCRARIYGVASISAVGFDYASTG